MKKSVLYIANFYGSPPLNYFEKYLKESNKANLTILKLPAVRSARNRVNIDAFIKDENDQIHPASINFFFPLPGFTVYIIQYLINFFLLFVLLSKIKRKKFDLIIAETNFGSSMAYILKKLGKTNYSIYFNGDILPDINSSKKCFFLPNNNSIFSPFSKKIDSLLVLMQSFLRKVGYKNDLIWYSDKKIEEWDSERGLKSKDKIIFHGILIDYKEYEKYSSISRSMNDICYLGRVDDYVGLDVIIPSIALLKKTFPTLKFHIIGGNEIAIEKYKKMAEKNGVRDNVKFYGYVPKMEDAYEIMSHCSLGIALYKPVNDNVSMYTNPSKPKDYIKVGLPVLVTKNGPQIGQEIVAYNAGLEINFNINDAASSIEKVLKDNNFYFNLIKGVERFAKKNDYSDQFENLWKEIIKKKEQLNKQD